MNVGMQHIAIKAPFEMHRVTPVCSLSPRNWKVVSEILLNQFADDGLVY